MMSLPVLLLAFAITGTEDKAVPVISGPMSGRVGDLLHFTASDSENAEWYEWTVLPERTKGFHVDSSGKKAVFSNHEPGEYIIILAVGNKSGGGIATHTVLVGEHLIASPPQSKILQFDPDQADGDSPRASKAKKKNNPRIYAVDWTDDVIGEVSTRKRQAQIVASSLRMAANMATTGNIAKASDLVSATAKLTKKSLGPAAANWQPWFDNLSEYLKEEPPKFPSGHVDLWIKLAEGLEGI